MWKRNYIEIKNRLKHSTLLLLIFVWLKLKMNFVFDFSLSRAIQPLKLKQYKKKNKILDNTPVTKKPILTKMKWNLIRDKRNNFFHTLIKEREREKFRTKPAE